VVVFFRKCNIRCIFRYVGVVGVGCWCLGILFDPLCLTMGDLVFILVYVLTEVDLRTINIG